MSMALVVLTRTPDAGRVKTRLIPALGADGAAALHAGLALETVRRAVATGLPVEVRLDGPEDHPFAADLRALGARVLPQGGGDLGERLARGLSPHLCAFVLGSDCVTWDPDWLRDAAHDPADVVLGPAEDGGYWTLGTRAPLPDLFTGIPWSTAEVLPSTLRRASALGLRVSLLPTCYDIDRPADLDRLAADPACPAALLSLLLPSSLLTRARHAAR